MQAYSKEFRREVLAACDAGGKTRAGLTHALWALEKERTMTADITYVATDEG